MLKDPGMSCAHAYVPEEGHEGIFSVDMSSLTYGRGAILEIGHLAKSLDCKRVAVFTEPHIRKLDTFQRGLAALKSAGLDGVVFDEVHIEPTDRSFQHAADFAKSTKFDGFVSIGGGSVIDSCKAAILYSTYPADFFAYVNKPVGEGVPVPGALPPHIACPTTCGTGAEMTGIAVFDLLERGFKTGIASRRLRPAYAVVDPDFTRSLPGGVVASSGFDVLAHAIESFTARPYVKRAKSATPADRPMSQGRNPWSDVGAKEALRLSGEFIVRAVNDANDEEARGQMMWAATLAGLAFGNAGVHVPHAMAYGVAGLAFQRSHGATPSGAGKFAMHGYDPAPLVPHGVSVISSAPAAFRFTASASPERHLEAARALGADSVEVADADVGVFLSRHLEKMMAATKVPVNLRAIGYALEDAVLLTKGTSPQRRLLDNSPRAVADAELEEIFKDALDAA